MQKRVGLRLRKLCNTHKGDIVMADEDTNIFELNQSQKYDKALFITYGYLECLIG